jgi:hypothetical protein
MISSTVEFLRGKKTYIVGILMILLGYLQGDNEMVFQGVGFMTLRAGLSKVTQ